MRISRERRRELLRGYREGTTVRCFFWPALGLYSMHWLSPDRDPDEAMQLHKEKVMAR